MTRNIRKIYNDLWADFENNPEIVIELYSKNSLFFNNMKTFKEPEDLGCFIEIVWHYLNAVYRKNRYNETIDFADKNLKIIDSELIRLNANTLKDDYYNGILHLKGMAAFQLRDYKTSTSIYRYLTVADPKNENFKNWLSSSSYRKKIWLVNTIYIVFFLSMLAYAFGKEYIEIFEIRISILVIGISGLIGNMGYEQYVNRSFRRKTKDHIKN